MNKVWKWCLTLWEVSVFCQFVSYRSLKHRARCYAPDLLLDHLIQELQSKSVCGWDCTQRIQGGIKTSWRIPHQIWPWLEIHIYIYTYIYCIWFRNNSVNVDCWWFLFQILRQARQKAHLTNRWSCYVKAEWHNLQEKRGIETKAAPILFHYRK